MTKRVKAKVTEPQFDGIPQFLERPKANGATFGTLERQRRNESKSWAADDNDSSAFEWVIKGNPQAIIMAKRLFPGSEGRGPGIVKFQSTPRIFPDLVWFLHRWPMEILDREGFERDYQAACLLNLKRADQLKNPVEALPPATFKGELRPFQKIGLNWAMTNRRGLLADDMGLGKTPTALAFMATAQEWPALVVMQANIAGKGDRVVGQWQKEARKFLEVCEPRDLPLFGGTGEGLKLHTITGRKPGPLPHAHIYFIHYLLLSYWRQALKDAGIKTLIFDEVQELRHSGTEKYAAASDLSSGATNVLGLSGTPIYNYGGEIWTVMNAIDYHCLGDYDSFSREWCYGMGVGKAAGTVKDTSLLHQYLTSQGLMIRRLKPEVLSELPPKQRMVIDIDSDEGVFSKLMRDTVALAQEAVDEKDIFTRGRIHREVIRQTRQATGVAKVPYVSAFVKTLMEAGQPTILFLHHHQVVDQVLVDLKEFRPVCYTGRESPAQKEAAKQAFIKGDTNLIIISLRSSTGIDGLQERARVVVFGELDWSPAIHTQGEDRAYRMNQKDSVLAYYLVSAMGSDPEMQEAIGLKVSQFVGIMGDSAPTEEEREEEEKALTEHMKALVAKVQAMQVRHRDAVA